MVRSEAEKELDAALKQLFPSDRVVEDMAIKCGRTTLYIDRVIKSKHLAFEVDGRQHFLFNSFFHSDAYAFKKAQVLDSLKTTWCEEHNFTLIRIPYIDKITVEYVRSKILEAYSA